MKRRFSVFGFQFSVGLLLAVSALRAAPPPSPLLISGETRRGSVVTTADALRTHVKFLASDALEGRLSGSAGERKAGDYAKKWFQDNGLIPAGVAGTYFQEFDLTVGFKPGANSRLVIKKHGKEFPAGAGVDYNPMLFSSNEEVAGAAVYVGYGLERNYRTLPVKGRIAVALSHPQYAYREVAKWAKEAGAIGIIFAGPTDKGMPSPSRINWQNAVAQETAIPAIAVSPAYFKKVTGIDYEHAKKNPDRVRAHANESLTVAFRAVPEPNAVKGRNVMAMLPGTDPNLKSTYIIIGAHIDHVGWGDIGSMSGNAKIHNGADDNASGIASILELAKHFAKTKSNKRSIVFQLYSGEEEGLVGSSFFVRNPTIDVKAVTAMFNLDMVGNLANNKLIVDGVRSSPSWEDMLKLASSYSVQKDPTGNDALGGRSDHGPWEGVGVPVLFFYTGEHSRYHRETDDWQLLNYEGAARITSTVADFIKAVDAMPEMLAFKKGNEVTERKPSQPSGGGAGPQGRRVRVGLVPNYTDEGPGLLLDGVTPGSPADKGGLKEGDRIVKWGDGTIRGIEDIQDIFTNAEPGKAVKVIVLRAGKEIELTITPEPPGM